MQNAIKLDNLNNLNEVANQIRNKKSRQVMIDLHIHTSESHEHGCDLTPQETLERLQAIAELLNVDIAFSITDHETVTGSKIAYYELKNNPEKYNRLKFIPGIEVNASLKSIEMQDGHSTYGKCHMLGYNYNIHDANLNAYSKLFYFTLPKLYGSYKILEMHPELSSKTINTGKQILAAINLLEKETGLILNFSDFECLTKKQSQLEVKKEFIKIAYRILDMNNCRNKIKSVESVIDKVLSAKQNKNIAEAESLYKIDIIKYVNLIKQAGGKVVIAHPNSITYNKTHFFGTRQEQIITNFINILQNKTNNGLDGLEIFHSSSSHGKAMENFIKIAKEKDMYVTGGSDFHGALYASNMIGHSFSRKFNEILNNNKPVVDSNVPNKLSYLPMLDEIFNNKQLSKKYGFKVTNDKLGSLTEETIIQTAKLVGDYEKDKKKQGVTSGLEEDIVKNIYKGATLQSPENASGVKYHKPKQNANKGNKMQEWLEEYEDLKSL